MRLLCLTLLITICPWLATAQCLTDFNKLVPEPSIDVTESFARISMFDNYLAIGVPDDDSLGRLAGLVRIYEKSPGGWTRIATLAPSDPTDAHQFGSAVKLSANYLLVAGNGYANKVHLFKKPAAGWQSQTELTSFAVPDGAFFGSPYRSQNTMAISDDENTIAITDAFYSLGNVNRSGAVFVYHKQPADEWDGAITPVMIPAPEDEVSDFGLAGVAIMGDRIITGTPFAPTANGRLYVFRDPGGEFQDLQLEAKLSAYGAEKTRWLGNMNFAVTPEGIFVPITVGIDTEDPQNVIAFYEVPASGIWNDTDYTCVFPYHPDQIKTDFLAVVATNGTDIVVSSRKFDGDMTGYSTLYRKGVSGWCDPVPELVDIAPLVPGQFASDYGLVNAINQSQDVAVALLPHPNQPAANSALKIISKNASGEWEGELLATVSKSTAGHRYGQAILGFEDYLFVGATGDSEIKPNGGAVYIYKKSSSGWTRTGKIRAPVKVRYDDVFGSALATNGKQLAVGATGFEEHGRVFVFNKNDANWSDPELVQEIVLPEDILTVFSYGDNLAMNDEWLLIPYVQNVPARIMLAAYRYNGIEWVYHQALEVGPGNLFAKTTTMAVAIEGQTVVAGSSILELNDEGIWQKMYTLSPSDPEPIRIAPDFSHWISNGSLFGHSVAISNNTIFIGAPTKDDGSTWDVGAIYVYTKMPSESWSNRTETVKLLPRVRNERELFGYSLKVFGNTLIAGAPGADFNLDGTARNMPGRAYIFQTEDYFWKTVTPLLDLTGDSFVKDYFGLVVNLDETDFFISAPIEDIESGKLSGSVYVTPAPPIVRLVPPVCSLDEEITLFGYPFGGTWSGPGIVDAAGIFDPEAVGPGEYELIYTTESCTYLGRLRIKVEAPVPPVQLLVSQEHFVCQQSSVAIPLAVESASGYRYLWYHRDSEDEPFFPLNEKQPSITANMRGEYKVMVSNSACHAFSPVITIKNDSVELTMNPIGRICDDASDGITLQATPEGGVWSGRGVTPDGKLFTAGLSDGIYTVTYQYTSSHQCVYQQSTDYQIDRMATPSIERLTGNLCREGAVTLRIRPPLEPGIHYSWMRKDHANAPAVDLATNGQNITVNARGIYHVVGTDGQCFKTSNEVSVNDSTFAMEILPDAGSFTTCDNQPFELLISATSQSAYQWYIAEDDQAVGTILPGQENSSISAQQTGYYYAVVTSGICSQVTPRKHVVIKPTDQIFVPNVITLNGDGLNDFFEIDTNMEVIAFRITNRYGKIVFTSGANSRWTGEGSPPGVYYWHVTYRTCVGEIKTAKGFVHLVQ